jgi:hypothetical protein
MGLWQTGYMEFHEREEELPPKPPPQPPTFPCPTCELQFLTERDLRVHTFEGHPQHRPILIFGGRECGSSRLTVTSPTTPLDWIFRDVEEVRINGTPSSVDDAAAYLAAQHTGFVDVAVINGTVRYDYPFEFALANAEDLDGVDAALERFIAAALLSPGAISDFIMRTDSYPTASKYRSGLASYLYGVLARENAADSENPAVSAEGEGYEAHYNKAVHILRSFDRAPAEAICGLVAFHYNQFDLAMKKTKSELVADISMRFQRILRKMPWPKKDLAGVPHPSLDLAISDSVIEQVLYWCAQPLDGTANTDVITQMTATIGHQRPEDDLKLRLIAAEHHLSAGDLTTAALHAEFLRHGPTTESWYDDFRRRLEGASK